MLYICVSIYIIYTYIFIYYTYILYIYNGLITQSALMSEQNSGVVGSNPTQINFL